MGHKLSKSVSENCATIKRTYQSIGEARFSTALWNACFFSWVQRKRWYQIMFQNLDSTKSFQETMSSIACILRSEVRNWEGMTGPPKTYLKHLLRRYLDVQGVILYEFTSFVIHDDKIIPAILTFFSQPVYFISLVFFTLSLRIMGSQNWWSQKS